MDAPGFICINFFEFGTDPRRYVFSNIISSQTHKNNKSTHQKATSINWPRGMRARAMNPHVRSAIGEQVPCYALQPEPIVLSGMEAVGGVSSFGLNGTIAHGVLSVSALDAAEHRLQPSRLQWSWFVHIFSLICWVSMFSSTSYATWTS